MSVSPCGRCRMGPASSREYGNGGSGSKERSTKDPSSGAALLRGKRKKINVGKEKERPKPPLLVRPSLDSLLVRRLPSWEETPRIYCTGARPHNRDGYIGGGQIGHSGRLKTLTGPASASGKSML